MGVKVITNHRNVDDLVRWLEANVGVSTTLIPGFHWHGIGWVLRSYGTIKYYPGGGHNEQQWEVEFNDESKATLFALRWP